MAKIIRIESDQVIVGLDNGTAISLSKSEFNFQIHELMVIDIYKHSEKYIPAPHQTVKAVAHVLKKFYEPETTGKASINDSIDGGLYSTLDEFGTPAFYMRSNISKVL